MIGLRTVFPDMKPVMTLISLGFVAAVASGCGGNTTPPAAPGVAQDLPDGRTFLSSSVTEGGKPRALASESPISLAFDSGQLQADAGCNKFSGKARADGDRLAVDNLGGTEMGCADELMDQDKWLVDFLSSKPTWRMSGDELVLSGDDTKITFLDREVAQPDQPLRGTKWELDGLVDKDAASSLPAGVKADLTFREDGTVVGNGGCNELSARYTLRGSQLTVTEPVLTRMSCGPDADDLERIVVEVLKQKLEYRIEAGKLTLESKSGQALDFRAAK